MSQSGPSGASKLQSVSSTAAAGDDATVAGTQAPDASGEATAALELKRGDRIGRYLLLDVLGQGGMGRVYQAYDPDLDRKVAIKLLFGRAVADAERRDRLLREAKAMARIDHPNVVTVFDAGVHDGTVFIAMELVEGVTLDAWLGTPRPRTRVLDVLLQAARGLEAAHAAGVVHRDFKPGNVLVREDGRTKVGDFGLAGIDDASHSDPHSGKRVGTPAYMSPEHFGGASIDARSDQFSFGITVYEALYGQRPFRGDTWPELAAKVLSGDVDPTAASRRSPIDRVLRRAMEQDPQKRYPSMQALIERVERIRQRRWRWWLLGGSVAAGLGAAAFSAGAEDPQLCDRGAARVGAWWSPETKAAIEVGGAAFTARHAAQVQQRFVAGIDDYASAWVAAFDASCDRVGPGAANGTVAERRTAECIENRYDSLRGLAEFATAAPMAPNQLDALLRTLPALEDCDDERWVPYPSDPEEASRAARLHQSVARIRRSRLADRTDGLLPKAAAVVTEARALGEPYLLARSLVEHARLHAVKNNHEAAHALLDEALQTALAAGHDALAATVVNATMLSLGRQRANETAARMLVAVGRGLLDDGRRDPVLMGNILLNYAHVLRRLQAYDRALEADEEAARHFASANDDAGVAKAGVNRAATLGNLGRLNEARAQLAEASESLFRAEGETAPNAFVARGMATRFILLTEGPKAALPEAARAHALAKETYAPGSSTRWTVTALHAHAALQAGEHARARRLIEELASQDAPSEQDEIDLLLLELVALEQSARSRELMARIPEARRRISSKGSIRHQLSLESAVMRTLFVLGRHDELPEQIASLIPRLEHGPEGTTMLNPEIAFIAVTTGLAPDPDMSWSAFARLAPPDIAIRDLIQVVEVVEVGGDGVAKMRKVRDAYAARYHERDPFVQMLESCLANADCYKGSAP